VCNNAPQKNKLHIVNNKASVMLVGMIEIPALPNSSNVGRQNFTTKLHERIYCAYLQTKWIIVQFYTYF
jgi:hypothetical protein